MKKLNHKNQVLAEKLALHPSLPSFQALSEAELKTLVGGKKGSFDRTGDPSQWGFTTQKVNEYEGQHL